MLFRSLVNVMLPAIYGPSLLPAEALPSDAYVTCDLGYMAAQVRW